MLSGVSWALVDDDLLLSSLTTGGETAPALPPPPVQYGSVMGMWDTAPGKKWVKESAFDNAVLHDDDDAMILL